MSLTANALEHQPKTRISARVREAIRLMVETGLKRPDAAQAVGLQDNSLYIAMRKPEVLAWRAECMQILRTSAASRMVAKAVELADDAKSESVKLDAIKWVAGLEGIAPVQRTENIHHLNVQVPGLEIVFSHREPAPLIHDQSHEPGSHSPINSLPPPVPHPSMRNAIETSYREVPEPSPVSAGVGENS